MTKKPFTAVEMMLAMAENNPYVKYSYPKPIDHMHLSVAICCAGNKITNELKKKGIKRKDQSLTYQESVELISNMNHYGINKGEL